MDIVTSLLKHIEAKLRKDDNTKQVMKLTKQISSFATDVFLRKSVGMSKKTSEHFTCHYDAITTISQTGSGRA